MGIEGGFQQWGSHGHEIMFPKKVSGTESEDSGVWTLGGINPHGISGLGEGMGI